MAKTLLEWEVTRPLIVLTGHGAWALGLVLVAADVVVYVLYPEFRNQFFAGILFAVFIVAMVTLFQHFPKRRFRYTLTDEAISRVILKKDSKVSFGSDMDQSFGSVRRRAYEGTYCPVKYMDSVKRDKNGNIVINGSFDKADIVRQKIEFIAVPDGNADEIYAAIKRLIDKSWGVEGVKD